MLMKIGFLVAAVALLTFAPKTANAAKTEAKPAIKGAVTDPAGKALKEVKIIAFNLDTGVALETKSDAKGNYEFKGLPKGDYELTALAEGYDLFGSEEIAVDETQPVTYDIQLVELFQRRAQPEEEP